MGDSLSKTLKTCAKDQSMSSKPRVALRLVVFAFVFLNVLAASGASGELSTTRLNTCSFNGCLRLKCDSASTSALSDIMSLDKCSMQMFEASGEQRLSLQIEYANYSPKQNRIFFYKSSSKKDGYVDLDSMQVSWILPRTQLTSR